jgi:hypothetical protein
MARLAYTYDPPARGMALPSIVLLVIFVGAVFLAVLGFMANGGSVFQAIADWI